MKIAFFLPKYCSVESFAHCISEKFIYIMADFICDLQELGVLLWNAGS